MVQSCRYFPVDIYTKGHIISVGRKSNMTLTDQLIQTIEQSGLTQYRIAKDTGVSCPIVQRFVSRERGITLETADKLAEYFGMRLTKPRRVSPK